MKKWILLVIVLILIGGFAYWQMNKPVDEEAVDDINKSSGHTETADWQDYTNVVLGYKITFPATFKAYSEMTGDELELKNDAKSIFMSDKDSATGFMISQSSTGGDNITQAFAEQMNRSDTEDIYANDNHFIYDQSTRHYFIVVNDNLLVIQFLANTDDDWQYISNLVLDSFTIVD